MKVAFLTTNLVKIYKNTKKGTEIFDYLLLKHLAKHKKDVQITAFASGDSRLPVPIESVTYKSSTEDKKIGVNSHIYFELALIAKAFSQQKKFDLFHVNTGVGELILPFAQFVKKPIVVTMHGSLDQTYTQKLFNQFKHVTNIHFISISNTQRKPFPSLNYCKTIYHGVDTKSNFHFNPVGDNNIIWTGRAIPDKGLDVVLTVAKKLKRKAKIFPIIKDEYLQWLHDEIIKRRNLIYQVVKIYIDFDVNRQELDHHYQTSKVFLFPLQWEEPFGFTIVESMACGTPVVAYARGSVPELIKDGETGFIVNAADDNIRGNWIIKKTGIEGLCEAVERIYAMPEDQYRKMRLACRQHVEKNFTAEQMASNYIDVYKQISNKR